MKPKKHSDITISEWIVYRWAEVTQLGDNESSFIPTYPRPLDEAMKMAGGSWKDLEPHLIVAAQSLTNAQ